MISRQVLLSATRRTWFFCPSPGAQRVRWAGYTRGSAPCPAFLPSTYQRWRHGSPGVRSIFCEGGCANRTTPGSTTIPAFCTLFLPVSTITSAILYALVCGSRSSPQRVLLDVSCTFFLPPGKTAYGGAAPLRRRRCACIRRMAKTCGCTWLSGERGWLSDGDGCWATHAGSPAAAGCCWFSAFQVLLALYACRDAVSSRVR